MSGTSAATERIGAALWHLARFGWRQAAAERGAMLGRIVLLILPILIFWQIWQSTPLAGVGYDAAGLLWYVTVTEWIGFAAGMPYRHVERAIRSGDIAVALTRPIPYGAAVLAEWLGGAAVRLLALGGPAAACATILTGTWPLEPAQLFALTFAAALGMALLLLLQFQIALSAVWLGMARPVFWIWQKLLFVLGGLLLPLTLYPSVVAEIARWTPFPAILFDPASLVLNEAPDAGTVVARQLAWLAAAAVGVIAIEALAVRQLVRRGC